MGNWLSQPGDLIEISRGLYQHWAVYVGDGDVVHLTTTGGASSSSLTFFPTEKAVVRKEKLKDVVGDDKWKINNILDKLHEPRPAHIIVEEALRQVGKWMEYSVTRNNCEHFATELRYGKALSIQGLMADVALLPFKALVQ